MTAFSSPQGGTYRQISSPQARPRVSGRVLFRLRLTKAIPSRNARTSAAERQARYRAKTDVTRARIHDLTSAFVEAVDLAGLPKLGDDLDGTPDELLEKLTERIRGNRLFITPAAPIDRPRRRRSRNTFAGRIARTYGIGMAEAREIADNILSNRRTLNDLMAQVAVIFEEDAQ